MYGIETTTDNFYVDEVVTETIETETPAYISEIISYSSEIADNTNELKQNYVAGAALQYVSIGVLGIIIGLLIIGQIRK